MSIIDYLYQSSIIKRQSLIINTIHIIVINAVPKCHRLMTDHKMSSLIRPQNAVDLWPTAFWGSAIVACGNIGSSTLKAPSNRVVAPVSQRDGGRFQKWKSCNDLIFFVSSHLYMILCLKSFKLLITFTFPPVLLVLIYLTLLAIILWFEV